uniref:Uncharacterized protein n=1 Tax=Caenorhabditis japonica TaxID=281687 RepID=A0A8R1EJP2_CAEJA
MSKKSENKKKKRNKEDTTAAKPGVSIDNEQQAKIQSDADNVNEVQPPRILVIVQSSTREIYTTPSNIRNRNARSIDPTRRIIRSMSASQHLRVNAFTMKPVATIPILSGTNKENFQENELEKQNFQAILRKKPIFHLMDTVEREHFCEDFSNKFEENGTFPKIPQNS